MAKYQAEAETPVRTNNVASIQLAVCESQGKKMATEDANTVDDLASERKDAEVAPVLRCISEAEREGGFEVSDRACKSCCIV